MNKNTRDTEGWREMEAAKQRLASAKSHASFVSTTLVTAKAAEETAKVSAKAAAEAAKVANDNLKASKKTREDIQSQLQNTKKEVADAKKFLADVEKRWEVIDVDKEDSTSLDVVSSNKKRKVSTSPQGNNNTTSAGQQNNTQSNTTHSSSNQSNDVNEIVVSGAGSAEFNGTYKKESDHNLRSYGHFPIFVMRKQESSEKFGIYQEFDHWWIGKWKKQSYPSPIEYYSSCYRSMSRSNVNEKLPPSLWMNRGGKAPPPKLQMINGD